MSKESVFERETLEEIEEMFPGCVILKNYPLYRQGIPDRLILFENMWAMLEFKESKDAPPRPNQPYYIQLLNRMSYASFIYPENKEAVLYELQQTFRTSRPTRLFESEQVPLDQLRSREIKRNVSSPPKGRKRN